MPRILRPVDPDRGSPLQDIWIDIDPPNSGSGEILGYPTQKPLALLERIIQGRRWIGIDVTHLSIALLKYRLQQMFPGITFQIVGEPEDLGAARQLAQDDRYQFQWWTLSLVRAKPLGGQEGSKVGKKGSDRGIDGVITFIDDNSGKGKRVLVVVA